MDQIPKQMKLFPSINRIQEHPQSFFVWSRVKEKNVSICGQFISLINLLSPISYLFSLIHSVLRCGHLIFRKEVKLVILFLSVLSDIYITKAPQD